jgi:hypothetical protein
MYDQLFDYTQEELSDFHKAVHPDMLSEVFDVVEKEHNSLKTSTDISNLQDIVDYISSLSPTQLDLFGQYIQGDVELDTKSTDTYPSPVVEILEGYIAISSSSLQALDKFKDRLVGGDITWEHRIKKHDGVTIHSYVFNINEGSI